MKFESAPVPQDEPKKKKTLHKGLKNLFMAAGAATLMAPAFGQKKQAEKQKELPPIYTYDKNDPRLKPYQDSLGLHEATQAYMDYVERCGRTPEGDTILSKIPHVQKVDKEQEVRMVKNDTAVSKEINEGMKEIAPDSYLGYDMQSTVNGKNTGGMFVFPNFVQPLQPVIYREFKPDGSSVYGPNGHLIGFYNEKNNSFKAIPEQLATQYGMHKEDLDFLNSKGLGDYLSSTLKMNNIQIEKPE